MKKLTFIAIILLSSCRKNDETQTVHRGQIVTIKQDMGKAVHQPFRIDSLARGPGDLDDSNWYWVTSENGVDVMEEGYYIYDCNRCNFDWVGESKWLPNPWTNGDSLLPRAKGN